MFLVIPVIGALLISRQPRHQTGPARRRQDFIDRRLYRRKYDAARALAQFAASTQNKVYLNDLTADLVQVVEDTMQSQQVTLGLKSTAESDVG